MKAKIFIIINIFYVLTIRAQGYEYVPLVNEEHIWSYAFVRQTSPADYEVDSYSVYQLRGDTVINELNYKKLLYGCSETYIAAVREVDKKVFIKEDQQEDQLLYDFNLQEGDWANYLHQVIKIDTIQIGDTKRKRFVFDAGYETWIEGIGALEDFYPLQARSLGYAGQGINYQKKGTEFVYKTDEWYFNENDCNGPFAAQNLVNQDFSLNYNKQKEGIDITGVENLSSISVFRLDGMGMLSVVPSNTSFITTKGWEKGIYIIGAVTKDSKIIARKIIIE